MLIRRGGFLLVTAWLLGALAQPSAAQSAPVYNPANGHWYQEIRLTNKITWPEATAAARAMSYAGLPGHLVTITSADENQFVATRVMNQTQPAFNYWTGGYQDRGAPDYREPDRGWRWVTGEPWGYTNWLPGEPNNGAGNNEDILIVAPGGGWNDLNQGVLLDAYLVEFESPLPPGGANAAGIVLFPNPVLGGQPALGQVTLAQPAGTGGEVLSLSSSNPAAAVVPASVTVPTGASSATFVITTLPVAAPAPVSISAACAFGPTSAVLQVLPLPAPPPAVPAGNLLVNGSFEQPSAGSLWATVGGSGLPGWRVTGGNVDVVSGSYWQPAPDGGHQSLDLVGNQDGTIEQSFATEPGLDYLFSGWIAHNADNPVAPEGRADVTLNGQPFVQLFHHDASATRTDMRWMPFSYRFRATSSTTTLAIADVTHTWPVGGAALDGLSVTLAPDQNPVPPAPATTTAVTPTAPTALSAHALSRTQLALSWRDTSTNQTALAIWRRDGAHDWARVGVAAPNATTYTDSGLTPGTIYNYRVRAINSTVASDWSNTVTVRTPGGT